MASEADGKELTFDILFGLGGELSDTVLKPAQGGCSMHSDFRLLC